MPISLNPAALLSGQGFDVTSLVNQILNQKSGQITQWAREQVKLQSQASLLTAINDDLSNLADAVTALSDPLGALTAQTATSSNTGILTATADSSAIAGNHTIIVSNLATAGLVYSNVLAGGGATSILPSETTTGDLQIQIGSYRHRC
jgi:flagellar hook-associated protein 2